MKGKIVSGSWNIKRDWENCAIVWFSDNFYQCIQTNKLFKPPKKQLVPLSTCCVNKCHPCIKDWNQTKQLTYSNYQILPNEEIIQPVN